MDIIPNIKFSSDDEIEVLSKTIFHLASNASAINKSQAIIEFNIDGTILTAKRKFLKCNGLFFVGNPGTASSNLC